MANSINIAMFLAIYMFIAGISLLINSKYLLKAVEELLKSKGQSLIVGFMALAFGAFILSFHSFYQLKWPLIITIIGWMALLKAVLYLIFPDMLKSITGYYKSTKIVQVHAIVVILISLFFAYKVFCNC